MDKSTFNRLMASPAEASPSDWEELRAETVRHPHCAPLQVLSLMADKANGSPLWERQSLPLASLYVMDVAGLYAQVDALTPRRWEPPQPEAASAASRPTPAAETQPQEYDILKEINAYQEVSFKTAPKSVILTNFLEKDGGIQLDEEECDPVSVQELAKNSLRHDGLLPSETLALVLERQGKYAEAAEVCEKIMSNNPEKSSTFAVRIADLRARAEAVKK